MIQKGILTLGNAVWNEKGRYKVNSTVNYNGSVFQNSTGGNSEPTLLVDWVMIKQNISLSQELESLYDWQTGDSQTFTTDEDYSKISLVTVNGNVLDPTLYTTPTTNTVIITDFIPDNSRIMIQYWTFPNVGTADYYTQAQVDAMIDALGNEESTYLEYYAKINVQTNIVNVMIDNIGGVVITRTLPYAFEIESPNIINTSKVIVNVSLDSNANLTDDRRIDYVTNNGNTGRINLILREGNVIKNYTSTNVNISLHIKIII